MNEEYYPRGPVKEFLWWSMWVLVVFAGLYLSTAEYVGWFPFAEGSGSEYRR